MKAARFQLGTIYAVAGALVWAGHPYLAGILAVAPELRRVAVAWIERAQSRGNREQISVSSGHGTAGTQ